MGIHPFQPLEAQEGSARHSLGQAPSQPAG